MDSLVQSTSPPPGPGEDEADTYEALALARRIVEVPLVFDGCVPDLDNNRCQTKVVHFCYCGHQRR